MPPSDINIEVTHKGSPLGLDPHFHVAQALGNATDSRESSGDGLVKLNQDEVSTGFLQVVC